MHEVVLRASLGAAAEASWSAGILATALTLALALALVAIGVRLEQSGWPLRARAVLSRKAVAWTTGRSQARCRLVGAGPGDPALLTLAARRALAEADVVIVDQLVPEGIVQLIRGRVVHSRKVKGCANFAQNELHEWMIEALERGEDVVRLKGGDPFLFGRGGEEVDVVQKHGFAIEVIPGISSALAAPLSAGLAVTTRGVADQLVIATGHGKHDSVPRLPPQFDESRTAVFLMGVSRMENLVTRLRTRCAYPASTPVAVIERATLPNQRVIRGTLEDIAALSRAAAVISPATIVIGRTAHALPEASYIPGTGAVRYEAESLPTTTKAEAFPGMPAGFLI
ncbi:Uroporphyrinogen-III C-methyltransferase [Hondaea fermentalgiana]|uniref:Uroporphyrinogen-III C-methyltransferase n=1 Tax=Hondaea fermentalgiana TaxID=2315210 RepID=A0A2R5GPJ2_9STRA|nr:Uroporphyrinogen-III C-methyltransferase [Hondaea fermentalgiana]|eukprot:GBG31698.1 Uroporphyrinogen-III C-methyltransferase [Hondaea fermentalgiana]